MDQRIKRVRLLEPLPGATDGAALGELLFGTAIKPKRHPNGRIRLCIQARSRKEPGVEMETPGRMSFAGQPQRIVPVW
jgi:hypothetical protein